MVRPSSIALRMLSTGPMLACPTTTRPSITIASPKYSASPSLSHGGSCPTNLLCAYWWKPSCWITCRTRERGSPSVKNASAAPAGVMKNIPPLPVPFTP